MIITASLLLLAASFFLIRKLFERSSADVCRDLLSVEERMMDASVEREVEETLSIDHPLAQFGIFTERERKRFERLAILLPALGAITVLALRLLFVPAEIAGHVVSIFGAAGLFYIAARRKQLRKRREYIQSLEFYLPVVMERLVMAAQAGLDILPAIKALHTDRDDTETIDPVSRLLSSAHGLTEAGLSFEESLHLVAQKVECSALRHAFIHLAVAHKEGGELVAPLRELSDATQLYFQESVEEEIARMPVKATAPLICTFAGLMVFFLASPLIQILEFVGRTKPAGL